LGLFTQTDEVDIRGPIIARETFNKFKHSQLFKEVAKKFLKNVKNATRAQKWAKIFHKEVQSHVNEVVESLDHPELIQCRKGCSACCYTQVSVTEEEAELLAQRVESGVNIDRTKLYSQAQAKNNAEKWYQMDHKKRGCVFLDENENCRVYEDRPAVCRTNIALSDPKFCDTSDGYEKPQRLLLTVKADLVVAVAYEEARSAGALPNMLDKALKKRLSILDRRL
jgi:Fe-S-cluster containining protein